MATYEIVRTTAKHSSPDLVTDLPPAEPGEVLFYDAQFWRVETVEPAHSREADGRLIVSPTTDEAHPDAPG
jgi:hypothetical protein